MVKLGDLCTKSSSNIAQKYLENCDGEYPIYGASGFIKNVNFYKQEHPYVAVVKDGAGVGRVMKLPEKSSVIGTMQYIIPNNDTDVSYLAYAMEYMDLAKYCSGATIPHIYFKDYCNEILAEHSPSEQENIAAVLDKVTNLIAKQKRQIELLDELVKARFVEMFGSIHNSNIYPYFAVKELNDVVSGGTPSRDKNEYWDNGTIPWVKTTELQNNVITEVEENITELGLLESSAKIVPAGTILIAMYGQGKTRGMTGYLGIKASTNQACACIIPSEKINSIFMWKYFEFSYDKLRNLAKGGNQPNLNSNIIKNFPVLVPPISMQKEFVHFVKQTDKSKSQMQKSLEQLETLKKALMQKYFG